MIFGIVLGNANNDDGTMSDIMLERMQLTLQLLSHTHVDKIILSGGIANKRANVSEAEVMCHYLTTHGVSQHMLILEQQSTTTAENALYSGKILVNYCVDSVILITSPQHMHRIILNPIRLFEKQIDSKTKLIPYCGGTL